MESHPYRNLDGLKEQLNLSDEEIRELGYKSGGIWFEDTTTLIMGTFPPRTEYEGRTGYVHYSSNRNKFWTHIDAICGTTLKQNYYPATDHLRIENAKQKIQFLRKYKLGFVDIFSMIQRLADDASDDNLVEIESIFNTETFEAILNSQVHNIVFVYKMAMDLFENELNIIGMDRKEIIRPHRTDDLPLEIKYVEINKRALHLKYVPIHGPNKDELRWQAVAMALGLNYEPSK
jgi:G:T/U-mismatch repair DNA glycosylase